MSVVKAANGECSFFVLKVRIEIVKLIQNQAVGYKAGRVVVKNIGSALLVLFTAKKPQIEYIVFVGIVGDTRSETVIVPIKTTLTRRRKFCDSTFLEVLSKYVTFSPSVGVVAGVIAAER